MTSGGNLYDNNDDDSQDNSDSQHKYYFQFDMESWNNWLHEALNEIDKSDSLFPVNDYFSSIGSLNHSLYLGNNHYKEPIYKTKYFVYAKLDADYKNHLVSHAVHFLTQPNYYMGMFDILN